VENDWIIISHDRITAMDKGSGPSNGNFLNGPKIVSE
jgi:hypothetical protein